MRSGKAFPLEDDGEFLYFAFGELGDLAAFRSDLGGVQLLFCLACEVGAAAHRDRARDRLGKACDDDQRAGRMGGRHARDNPERHEQAVLSAQHELADAREPPDPRSLTQGMLLDVPRRFGSGRRGVDRSGVRPLHRGAPAAARRVAGSRPLLMRSVPGQRLRYRSEETAFVRPRLSSRFGS